MNSSNFQRSNMSSTLASSLFSIIETYNKNPIYYKQDDLKKTTKWKKYMKKIHILIMNEFPNICLIKKTNNAYMYESNTHRQNIAFECRYEGSPEKQKCTCVVYEQGIKVFHKTKKTPKRLYRELTDYVTFKCSLNNTTQPGIVPLVFSENYTNSFISQEAEPFTSFLHYDTE